MSLLVIYIHRVGTDSQAPEDADYKNNDNENAAVSNGGSNNNVYNSTDTCKTNLLMLNLVLFLTHFTLQWTWIQQNI